MWPEYAVVASQGMAPLEPGRWSCLVIGGGMTAAAALRLTANSDATPLLLASALWSLVLLWALFGLLRIAVTRVSRRPKGSSRA